MKTRKFFIDANEELLIHTRRSTQRWMSEALATGSKSRRFASTSDTTMTTELATHIDNTATAGRLREMLKKLKLDATVFCTATGVPYSTMRTYMSGVRPPSPELLVAAFRVYRISATWLLAGIGPMTAGTVGASDLTAGDDGLTGFHVAESPAPWRVQAGGPANTYTRQLRGEVVVGGGNATQSTALMGWNGAEAVRPLVLTVPLGDGGGHETRVEYQVIPRRSRPAAAGALAGQQSGVSADEFDLAGEIAFSFDWLRKNMGQTVGQLSLVQVEGTSMAPVLMDGDTIMIDEGVNAVGADAIYVLDIHGRRLVKRVQHLVDGTLILISDNPAYQPEKLPRDVARNVRVVGRMVWPRIS